MLGIGVTLLGSVSAILVTDTIPWSDVIPLAIMGFFAVVFWQAREDFDIDI